MAIRERQLGTRKHSVTITERREATEERNFPGTGGSPAETWVRPGIAEITQPLWSITALPVAPKLGKHSPFVLQYGGISGTEYLG